MVSIMVSSVTLQRNYYLRCWPKHWKYKEFAHWLMCRIIIVWKGYGRMLAYHMHGRLGLAEFGGAHICSVCEPLL
jgi:hypothetical protein